MLALESCASLQLPQTSSSSPNRKSSDITGTMLHDTESNVPGHSVPLSRHHSGAEVARVVLHQRLRRIAGTHPAALLGVLEFWLGPQAAPDSADRTA
jgi:hypothetical protein